MRELTWIDSLRAEFLLYVGARTVALRDALVMRLHPGTEEGRLRCEARDAVTQLVHSTLVPRAGHTPLEGQIGLPVGAPRALAVLCHGIGERLFFWKKAQQMLAEAGIASLVFHYSGYGVSQGRGRTTQFEADTISACQDLRNRFPATPLFLLGTSLGSAVAIHAADRVQPAGLVLSQGFPSLRQAAREMLRVRGLPPAAAVLLPDAWRSAEHLRELTCPVLVVHGSADELFPIAMGEALFHAASAREGCASAFAGPDGFRHSGITLRPEAQYWEPILDFIWRWAGR